ncbi:hypothetical protein LX81_02762 [Palleronia aestuarii]|uniref:VOC domain-containing protein n=1 Tax=Palleronia aestuarii TaxID=568105 RepID=A0A2W7N4A5_9RHOB|nr:VOC family protein [Palleronia aestuarii]PZX14911.1 hypothetical protein LX81_02762 [Palleronia aestuarii]
MTRAIYINLPVEDVARATAFYEAVGFEKNDAFSNAQASAMRWSEAISVMLLDRPFYATFTEKTIIDARTQSGALLCLTFDGKAEVDDIHRRAVAAGGRNVREIKDQGFMYGGAFEDPDGHIWETLSMNPEAGDPASVDAK